MVTPLLTPNCFCELNQKNFTSHFTSNICSIKTRKEAGDIIIITFYWDSDLDLSTIKGCQCLLQSSYCVYAPPPSPKRSRLQQTSKNDKTLISLLINMIWLWRRNGRLFFVSSSSTTSTVLTNTICFSAATGFTACGRKKRRSIELSGEDETEASPTPVMRFIVY